MAMPEDVQDTFGYALHLAQTGKRHEQAKQLKGLGSAGVLEVVEDDARSAYRAVYTVRFKTRYTFFTASRRRSRGASLRSPTWT